MTEWREMVALSTPELKAELFSVLQDVSERLYMGGGEDAIVLGAVPRIAELLMQRPDVAEFKAPLSGLARAVGLWNYIDREVADTRDSLISSAAEIPQLDIVLHREQVAALNLLLSGSNLILSAPTSFGKSILIDALLLNEKYKRVAVVVPTIALLDEFRRRFARRFGSRFSIVTHHSENADGEQVIFLGTQERLINRSDLGRLDLVVVDEFYKLDPYRRDDRSIVLNAAVYKLLSRGKQFFFLGPNVDNVAFSEDSRWQFQFLRTRFSTVAVDTYDLGGAEDKQQRLFDEIAKPDVWPALVFVSSPDKANELAIDLTGGEFNVGSGAALADWMAVNYGPQWFLTQTVRSGVAVHHARIPRALASRFISLFNAGVLPILLCTSTLIEGVNTAAKSVLIYDKTIDRRNYDFFTYSNIKGRAGRLGEHHTGQVYLFHAPPEQNEVGVTAPLFQDLDEAPDEFIVHIEAADTTPSMTSRIGEIAFKVGLSPEEIRRFSSIKIDVMLEFQAAITEHLERSRSLIWTGFPVWENLEAIASVLCKVKRPSEFGARSVRQLTMLMNLLRNAGSMRVFFRRHFASYNGDAQHADNVFKFLRSAEFNLPEYIALLEALLTASGNHVDFSYLVGSLPRWFRLEALKMLEEEGVPIQISERFASNTDTVNTLRSKLLNLAIQQDPRLSILEREWLLYAIPR